MPEAIEHRIPTAVTGYFLSRDETARWLIIAALILTDLLGLPAAHITADWASLDGTSWAIGFVAFYGVVFDQVQRRTIRLVRVRRFTAIAADFCFSALQLGVFSLAVAPVTYIAARAGLPLVDMQLTTADRLLDFDWSGFHDWVHARTTLHEILSWVYFSHIEQSWIVIILGSLWFPGRRNSELIWAFMISSLICIVISVFLPALSMGGDVAGYVPVLEGLRRGEPMVLDWGQLQGIVSFPSFHSALAVILIYAARHRLWALIPFAVLDTTMLVTTPPIGGHYLVDTLAGIGVALVSIAAARRFQPVAAVSKAVT